MGKLLLLDSLLQEKMEEDETVSASATNHTGDEVAKKVKKRIDMVKAVKPQVETVRVSARQAQRKAMSSRESSEEKRGGGDGDIVRLKKENEEIKETNIRLDQDMEAANK